MSKYTVFTVYVDPKINTFLTTVKILKYVEPETLKEEKIL
jgi:hypothetical protein